VFSVTVRDHFMVAHSFHGEVFGPAQRLHGATYVVDATFRRETLDADNIVVDIGRAGQLLHDVLAGLTYRLMMVNKRLADMTGSAESRAARLFLTLADRVGIPRGDGVFIPLPLSRQEVADLIGTTLETAIRLMSRWQKDEFVLTEKTGFLIPAADRLQELATTS